jgi:hypothetical protein
MKLSSFRLLLPALLAINILPAQTAVDLRAQSRNIDFSTAAATRPFKTGASLPATCSTGESYFNTDAPAGKNLFVCAATNTWTQLTGLTIVDVLNTGPGAVEILKTETSASTVTARQLLTGEGLVVTQQTDTVAVEADTAVTPRYATAGEAPSGACQTGRDQFIRTAGFPHFYGCVDEVWKPVYAVTTVAPATCFAGEFYFNTSDSGLYGCTATDTWTRLNRQGIDLTGAGECVISYSCSPTNSSTRAALPAEAAATQVTAIRVVIPYIVKLGRGLMFVASGGTAEAFAAAIYRDNNGAPGNKIDGSDLLFVNLAASAFRQGMWGNGGVILAPGVYWLGFSSESTTALYHLAGGTFSTSTQMMATLLQPGAVTCSNPATGTGASYTLPETCGNIGPALTLTDPPIIMAAAQ